MTAFYLCSAEVRLALYNLRQSSHGPSAGKDAQTYTCVSTLHPSPAGFIWSGAHSPVAALSGWSTPWTPPSVQESNWFLPHLLEHLFLILFQPLSCNKLLTQFPVPARYSLHFPISRVLSSTHSGAVSQLVFFQNFTASILYRQCHKIIHQQWKEDYSLILLFTLGLETQATRVFNNEPNCYLRNAI